MIPDDVVDRVRDQADAVAVIGEFVKLKRVGSGYRGPCPFHGGKNDNFSISPRGGYKCFVCGESGDVFTFVQKQLGLDFVEAVKWVGAKSGIEVREVERRQEQKDEREPLFECLAAAAEFFQRQLWDEPEGEPARAYLESRALPRDVSEKVGLGFASRDPIALRDHLRALGHDDARQLESGLLVLREDEKEPRPRFRGRLMFPIHDAQGRVIAFGGRVIGQGEPKYLNSPETPVFSKGRTLYGLNRAKNAIRKDDRVLVVEGYFDAVRVAATGVESVVAPLGTALTDEQAKLMRRYTGNAYLLYDSDKAGLKATFRAGDELLRQGMRVLVVTLPDGEDPDTFARSRGRDGLEAHLSAAMDVFERKVQILERGGWFADLRRKRAALDRLIPTIRATADPLTKDLYLGRAAEAAGIGRDLLAREVESAPDDPRRAPRPAATTVTHSRGGPEPAGHTDRDAPQERRRGAERRRRSLVQDDFSERALLRALLHHRELLELAAEHLGPKDFRNGRYGRIFEAMLSAGPEADHLQLAEVLDPPDVPFVEELLADTGGIEDPRRLVDESIDVFGRGRVIKARQKAIDEEMKQATDARKDELLLEKTRLRDELNQLKIAHWKLTDSSP